MPEKTTGFALPAQGYEGEGIDLNRLPIRNSPAVKLPQEPTVVTIFG
jgi:hypothetical protein